MFTLKQKKQNIFGCYRKNQILSLQLYHIENFGILRILAYSKL